MNDFSIVIPNLGTCTASEERWRQVHADAKAIQTAIEAAIQELAPVPGDVTGDGKVDAFDINTVVKHWQEGV